MFPRVFGGLYGSWKKLSRVSSLACAMFPRALWLFLLHGPPRFGGAHDRAEVSIGMGVLFSHRGALVELYCLWLYWPCGGWFCLWKDGLGGRNWKLLKPLGMFLCIAFISWRDFVTLIA